VSCAGSVSGHAHAGLSPLVVRVEFTTDEAPALARPSEGVSRRAGRRHERADHGPRCAFGDPRAGFVREALRPRAGRSRSPHEDREADVGRSAQYVRRRLSAQGRRLRRFAQDERQRARARERGEAARGRRRRRVLGRVGCPLLRRREGRSAVRLQGATRQVLARDRWRRRRRHQDDSRCKPARVRAVDLHARLSPPSGPMYLDAAASGRLDAAALRHHRGREGKPFAVAVYRLDRRRDRGRPRAVHEALLKTYAMCEALGSWPAYPEDGRRHRDSDLRVVAARRALPFNSEA
jgi:hypothetical protein